MSPLLGVLWDELPTSRLDFVFQASREQHFPPPVVPVKTVHLEALKGLAPFLTASQLALLERIFVDDVGQVALDGAFLIALFVANILENVQPVLRLRIGKFCVLPQFLGRCF